MFALGSLHTVTIHSLTDKGDGIATLDQLPLYVEGAYPGEEVEVALTHVAANYFHGQIVNIVHPSADRCADFCPYQGCGGCQVRTLSYPAQLELKRSELQKVLAQAELNVEVAPVLGMETPFHWRNKAQFALAASQGGCEIGFYRKHSHQVIRCDACAMQAPGHDQLLARLRSWLDEERVSIYDETTHQGVVRHIMTRVGAKSGEWMVVIVTNGHELPSEESLLARLADLPLTTIVQSIHPERGNRVLGLQQRVLRGEGVIVDQLLDLEFVISPLSFYQVNPTQAEQLYRLALEAAALTGKETLFDLYCGIGTLSLVMAKQAKAVIGIEVVADAVNDAKQNAQRNQIDNVRFITGKAEVVVPNLYDEGVVADVVVVDPPRKGCDQKLLEMLALMAPERIVYVSCNPKSLARDLAWLIKQGYQVERVVPVDMFPHTLHVESVTTLVRSK